jgi:hypothetical protein
MPAKGVGIRANAEFATRRDACEDRAASSCYIGGLAVRLATFSREGQLRSGSRVNH